MLLLGENMFLKFPYYIVRFKPKSTQEKVEEEEGFHTTQYDLNIAAKGQNLDQIFCFHTTQYDLNSIFPTEFYE